MSYTGWTSTYTCALASVMLLACGSVGGPSGDDDEPGGDFTIVTNPSSLTLPIAGSGTATVTVERTGSVGDITLSASGLGANVSATFSPNPIPANATTSQATISIAGGSAPATTSVMVTGTAGSIQHAAALSVTSTTIAVTGTIRGNRSGVKVGILGKQSVTSGAGGVFTFTDVIPPYDIYTFADGGSTLAPTPTVFLFKGLTRTDPTVSAPSTSTPGRFVSICITCPNAPVKGTRGGPGTNTDPIVFAWTSLEGSFRNGVLNTDGTYDGTIQWRTGENDEGVLHMLQFTRKPSGAPQTFIGYAKTAAITVQNGTTSTINLTATPVNSTATLTGTLNGPGGAYPMPSISLFQELGSKQATLWTTNTTNTVDATFPLIAAAGGTTLFASASLADGSGSSTFVQPLTATVTLNFTMPAAAVLGLPAEAATGVTTSTHFTWTSAPSTINEVNINTGDPVRAAFKIFTTGSDVTIPVVPELSFPANQSFSWRVVAYGPNASIDEAAASNELETVSSTDYLGPGHAQTTTSSRAFTSAP